MLNEPHSPPRELHDEGQRRAVLVLRMLPVFLIPLLVSGCMALLLHLLLGEPPPPPVDLPAATLAPPAGELPPVAPPPPPFALPFLSSFVAPHLMTAVTIVLAIVLLGAIALLVRLQRPTLSAWLLLVTWTAFTVAVALRTGATGPWPGLYVIPICAAGLLFGGGASVGLAALGTLLLGGSVWLQSQGLMPGPPLPPFPGPPPPSDGAPVAWLVGRVPPFMGVDFWIGLYWSVAALTALLAGGLQRALRHSRAQTRALAELSGQLEVRVAAQTEELAQRAARAEALYQVGRALTSTLDLTTVLGIITDQAARLLQFDSALVLLAESEGGGFTVAGAAAPPDTAEPSADAVSGDAKPPPAALVAALRAHEPTLRQVVERREGTTLRLTAAGGPALAVQLLPLSYGRLVTGVLVLAEVDRGSARSADDLALATGFADQAAVAIANARFLAQAREAATVEERARLARDIHDTLAQGLAGIVVQLGAAERAAIAAPAAAADHLALACQLARESLAEARRSVWNLRAAALDGSTLPEALQVLVARPLGTTVATFQQHGAPWPLQPAVESALLRVAQEALANVAKHARASRVELRLEYAADAVCLSVADDGIGLDAALAAAPAISPAVAPTKGFGLRGMRERLAAHGGTLQLSGTDGTKVLAIVPRVAAEASAPEPAHMLNGARL